MISLLLRTILLILPICGLTAGLAGAQFNDLKIFSSAATYLSGNSVMPFWMVSNNYGKIPDHSSAQLLELGISSTDNTLFSNFKIDYGLDFVYTYAGRSELKVQEYFIRLKYKPFLLRIGAIQDSTRYNGLSSTNGSILYSNNYR